MSIIINGMNMPKGNSAKNLLICSDGKVFTGHKDDANYSAEERKTGKWIYGEDEYGTDGYHCDKCGFFVPWDYLNMFINCIEDYKFCPNCGARMENK